MSWTPEQHDGYDAIKGYSVYTSDEEKIGTIREVFHPRDELESASGIHYFRVEPGTIEVLYKDVQEVYVPEQLVQMVDLEEDRVVLEVPKSELARKGFTRPPELNSFRPG